MELSAEPFAAELPWNERLEFLGDSVLGLAVSRRLMAYEERFAEGELSRIRAAVVNEESLADAARRVELASCMLLGKGAVRTGALERDSLLADGLEALLGAVFVDGGFDAADHTVGRLFDKALDGDPQLLVQTDFKTMLQELTQERLRVTPTYEVTAESGPDHDKKFEVRVMIAGQEMGRGAGASKKRASQAAARMAIEKLVKQAQAEGAS
jgi:ribonuclease-3